MTTTATTSLTLGQLLAEHARRRPDSPAVTCGAVTRTFADLERRSGRVAAALAASGTRRGDRVGVLDRNCTEFYEVVLGCARIGAAAVGLNWRLSPAELSSILADADVSAMVVGPEQAHLLPAGLDLPVVQTGQQYEAWLATAPQTPPADEVGLDDPVLVLYSSGTTGLPKGTVITHQNLTWSYDMAGTAWRMGPDSVNLVPSPLFHIGGIGYGLTTFSQGGHTVVARDAAAAGLLAAIGQHGVTHAFLVPAVIQSLLDAPEVPGTDLSSLQLVGYGGAPMTETLLSRAMEVLGCGFLGVYGMTETSGTVMVLPPEDHDPGGPRAHLLRSVGRPLPWVELEVRDPVSGEPVPPGQVGEIWVRAGQNTPGYWNQPAVTAQTLVDGGWLRTGDGAHQDEQGYVYLHDRLKDMIISGGENVYPAEVENALASHPAVQEVAVIAVPHPRWGETVKAVVALRPGTTATEDELVEHARGRLARYKCPTSIDVVEALPRNASGKVLKKDLRQPYWTGTAR
ncbi:MAG: hypothetical protein JWN08_1790 [Frankiales bacterium]|nr:hypothetical protein [Frankiales bacterium]